MFPENYEVEVRDMVDAGTRWYSILFHIAAYIPTQHGIGAGYTLFYLGSKGEITAAPPGAKVRLRDS